MKKRFLLFPSVFLTLYFFVMIFINHLGYFTALFMRNDLLYFMLIIPMFVIIFIFGIVYMSLQINWKDGFKTYWKRLAILITYVYIFFINIFIPDIYMTTSISLQIFIGMIPLFTLIGLWTPSAIRAIKDIKEAK